MYLCRMRAELQIRCVEDNLSSSVIVAYVVVIPISEHTSTLLRSVNPGSASRTDSYRLRSIFPYFNLTIGQEPSRNVRQCMKAIHIKGTSSVSNVVGESVRTLDFSPFLHGDNSRRNQFGKQLVDALGRGGLIKSAHVTDSLLRRLHFPQYLHILKGSILKPGVSVLLASGYQR